MTHRLKQAGRRKQRTRFSLKMSAHGRARLSVFRSGRHIYAQVINDEDGKTVAAASTIDADIKSKVKSGASKDSAVLVGKLLSRLNRTYGAVTGAPPAARSQSAWMKSLRAERESSRLRTMLDVVMVWSVAVALVCFAVWFFVFAGSSLPS